MTTPPTGLSPDDLERGARDLADLGGTTTVRITANIEAFLAALRRAIEMFDGLSADMRTALANLQHCRRHPNRLAQLDGIDPTLCRDCHERGFYVAAGLVLGLIVLLAAVAIGVAS